MWASMRARQITAGELDLQSAQDLMAFFYAARFFEGPGDAGRGKRAFQSRGCAGCHGLTGAVNPKAKPVSQWQALANPFGAGRRCHVEIIERKCWRNPEQRAPPSSATSTCGILTGHTGILAELARNAVQGGRIPHRRDWRATRQCSNRPVAPSVTKRWKR